MVTVTDKRLQHSTDSKVVDYYQADVATAQEYYSFGALMPARTYTFSSLRNYRYGFNGKENDNEVKGMGNEQDYGARIYDNRVGRFLSVDPLSKQYPWYTPYSFGGNSPIKFIDLDGKEEYNPQQDPYFVAKLLTTTFYEVKHSIENLAYNEFVPADPGKKWLATYKVENGRQVFETVIRQVPVQGAVKEILNTGLDVLNVVVAGKAGMAGSVDASVFLAESGGETQVTKTIREGANIEKSVLRINQESGYIREAEEAVQLKKENPTASVQSERYLRDADGKILKDPVTGEARRIDFAVIENGQVKKLVETTSLTASKTAQTLREGRIRAAGGTYIRDRQTHKLIDVSKVPTEIKRRP